jgi:hypothetical protein
MDTTIIVLTVIIALLVGGFFAYMLWAQKRFALLEGDKRLSAEGIKLQLAAYERITLFTERIRLSSLVNRLYDSGLSARQMQQVLLNNIREEYDHNVTQQLYIKPELWEAITKMKDQNAYIINQLAALAPPNATALDLTKKILDFNLGQPDSTMNRMVLDALQYEVKSLLER